MKSFVIIAALLLVSTVQAANNTCYKPGHFAAVPHDRNSTVTLSACSVRMVGKNTLAYNLGRETITIIADSAAARHFIAEVNDRRCGARVSVRLTPVRKSPFNTAFKAR